MSYYTKLGRLLTPEEVELGRFVFEQAETQEVDYEQFLSEFYDSVSCECCATAPEMLSETPFIQGRPQTSEMVWARSVMLPDQLRKVWILFVQQDNETSEKKKELVWNYPGLQLIVKVRNLARIKKLKATRPMSLGYKNLLQKLVKKVLKPKRIKNFKSQHPLRPEAALIEDLDWRIILKEALTEPGMRSPGYEVLWPYSLTNQQLLFYQMRKRDILIGPVKTSKYWKETLGTNIAKGEKGLYALVPDLPRNSKQSLDDILEEEEKPNKFVTKFRLLAYFFAYSQTEKGKAEKGIPEIPKMPAFDPQRAMVAFGIESIPYEDESITDDEISNFTVGFSQFSFDEEVLGEIAIRPGIENLISTYFHEMGHILLGHNHIDYDYVNKRGEAELEAESVSLLCLIALNLSNREESMFYIKGWYAGEDYPEGSAQKVMNVASRILKAGIPR